MAGLTLGAVAGAASNVAKIGSAISGIGSALGIGGGGRTSGGIAREELRMRNRAIKEKPDYIRRGAERAGFNPLTYMMSGAASSAPFNGALGTTTPLASTSALLGQVGSIFDSMTTEEAEEQTRKSAETQLKRIEKQASNAGGAGPVVEDTSLKRGVENVRPQGRPRLDDEFIPIFRMDGTVGQIPRRVAERLKINAWEYLSAGDEEELFGDELGQAIIAPRIPSTLQTVHGGLSGYGPEERRFRFDNRGNLGSLFGSGWSQALPPSEPPTMQNKQPEPGWMDRKFGQ